MEEENFRQWLQRRHSAAVPATLVREQVTLAVKSDVARCQRVVVGQMNEVYDVGTTDGRHVIVRISREADPRFEGERWALDQARAQGVPTAQVFRIEHIELGDERLTIEVQEKLPGTALSQLPPSVRSSAELADSVGAALAGIHSVPVEGLGYLQPDGSGWDITFASIMLDLLDLQEDLLAAAAHWGVEPALVDRGLHVLSSNKQLYELPQPTLVHGDLQPDHILVDNGAISGIIDFQDCSGGHPALDFAKWHATCPRDFDTRRLRAGYANQHLLSQEFDRLFALVLLRQSLWMLMVRRRHDNPFGMPRLLADIKYAFQALTDAG